MNGNLSERDLERFAELREKLEDVSRSPPSDPRRLSAGPGPLDPMLARTFEGTLASVNEDEWIAERKYDGTRIILEKFDGDVKLFTRRHVDRSDTLDELASAALEELPDGIILDGEYTFLTPDGECRFLPIHVAWNTVEEEDLSPQFFVFDILALESEWVTRDSLLARKELLAETVPDEGIFAVVDYETDGFQEYFDSLVDAGEEGIMIKRRGSQYHIGTRSNHWRKVKAFRESDFVVVGFTPGTGARSGTFGALILTDGERFVGRVGSGFSNDDLDAISEMMTPTEERAVSVREVGRAYTPVEPFVAQVKFQEVTRSNDLRAPVFIRLRPEKPVSDVEPLRDWEP